MGFQNICRFVRFRTEPDPWDTINYQTGHFCKIFPINVHHFYTFCKVSRHLTIRFESNLSQTEFC